MWANLITLSRLFLAAAIALLVTLLGKPLPISASLAVLLAALAVLEELTDALDGIVARATGTASELGGILDPLCDSLSRLMVYFAFALVGWVSLLVPLVMVVRDILVAYTRVVNAMTGLGKTSARLSGKAKAVVQGGGIFVFIAIAALFGRVDSGAPHKLGRIVEAGIVIVTAWSLLDYINGARGSIKALLENKKP
jgi:CDP-diacylglycerol--glycerol-3-phosphate 3-phosphatidyltransferase